MKSRLEAIESFRDALEELKIVSFNFPTGICKTKDPDQIIREGEILKNRPKPESLSNSFFLRKKKSNQKNDFIKNLGSFGIWVKNKVCGPENDNKKPINENENLFDSSDLIDQELKSLDLIYQIMYSNPVVLYTPNNSLIENNIVKYFNKKIDIIDRISHFCHSWLKSSPNLVNKIKQNKVNENLEKIQNFIQNEEIFVNSSFLNHMLKIIQKFKTINESEIINKIEIIDTAACSWLSIMSGVNLNIFKGFSNENDLVDYFLKKAYSDNVTVIASLIFDIDSNAQKFEPHVKYKIRQNASFTYDTRKIRNRVLIPGPNPEFRSYYYYIFGMFQFFKNYLFLF